MLRFPAKAALGLAAVACLAAAPGQEALAHHSFAVFFTADKDATSIKGAVTGYRFTNPHGTIDLLVVGQNGTEERWRVETNSPSILTRRGWTRQSLAVGDMVTIEGWRAQDGSKYMRLRAAFRADGSRIGTLGLAEGSKP